MVGIGFFAPLPLALMMPFMAGQSMVMGEAFGKSYQYGKRKISSMSNEEFNAMSPADLAKDLQTDYLTIMPSLKASMVASRDFQSFIIQELANIVKQLPKDVATGFVGNQGQLEQTSQALPSGDPIDYGILAMNIFKMLIGPVGTGFLFPQQAHAEEGGTIQGNVLDTPPSQLGTPDPPYTGTALKDQWINKIKDYSWADLLAINSYTTVTSQQKTWTHEFMNSPAGQAKAPKIQSTTPSVDLNLQQTQYVQWIHKRDELFNNYLASHGRWATAPAGSGKKTGEGNKVNGWAAKIKTLSNDYRNPNPLILRDVLALRKMLSEGRWGRV